MTGGTTPRRTAAATSDSGPSCKELSIRTVVEFLMRIFDDERALFE